MISKLIHHFDLSYDVALYDQGLRKDMNFMETDMFVSLDEINKCSSSTWTVTNYPFKYD